MTAIDWMVIALYLGLLVGLSGFWGRAHESGDDYYVGGRRLPWWALGISCMATQSSAISFISIPAFVALKQGGGMSWFQFELAVPLAMIVVMAFLIPYFRSLRLVSVYEYLETRFGTGIRLLVSLIFLLSRAVGTAAGVYATAVVLSVCLGTTFLTTLLIIGVVTIIYDVLGGMNAVVYSDVMQMGILVVGIFVCVGYALDVAGGWGAAMEALPPERFQTLNFTSGVGDGNQAPFWAFLIGGIFLYSSYYGVDQTQAQRGLCAPSSQDAKRALIFNGFARFPLTLGYLVLGLAVAGAFVQSEKLQAAVPPDKLDQLVPQFILLYLPEGVRALLFAALLAAAMSSLDSSINSLSAVTMRDFVDRQKMLTQRASLWSGRAATAFWGGVTTVLAFYVGRISPTVIETVNKVGSAAYGPILAVFLVGILTHRVGGEAVAVGLIAGMGTNLSLWLMEADVHWMWWNVIGFAVTAVAAGAVTGLLGGRPRAPGDHPSPWSVVVERETSWLPTYGKLVGYFVVILVIGLIIQKGFVS